MNELPNQMSHATPEQWERAVGAWKGHFGERFQTATGLCRQHANTLTWIASEPPQAVLFATSTEDVSRAITIAAEYRVPVIAFGAGTSLEGHVNAPAGGISVDLSRMNRVLQVNEQDLDCVVEAGVTRGLLERYLRDTGLFFPVDPGAEEATLGGMAATRASGTCAVRYGTMRENVLNLTAVMADGSVIKTAQRARKSSAGYDLTHLLVGSEGTLGIITELTLRLYGQPESIRAAVAPFTTLKGACDATMEAIQLGLGLARIELLDAMQIRAINQHARLGLQETPTLFLEFHGSESATREQVGVFEEIARSHGATAFEAAAHEDDRRRLWRARHEALWACRAAWPGKLTLITDVCVPISRLAECVAETEVDIQATGLIAPIVGHVGDGNFHVLAMFEPDEPEALARVKLFADRLARRAIAMGGTCTGEHGVGQGKMDLIEAEHGAAIATMRAVKRALDPLGILNPGKIVRL